MVPITTQSDQHAPVSRAPSGPCWLCFRSRYSGAPAGRARPVTIAIQPPDQPIPSKRVKGAHRRQRDRAISVTNINNNQPANGIVATVRGSLKPRGLTWDVDVPAFMIGHLAPVPLSRRNVCLLHQKSPWHDQLTPGTFGWWGGELTACRGARGG